MQNVIKLILTSALTIMASSLLVAATGQQSNEPNASPQQEQPSAQGHAQSSAVVQSVTGCVVKTENGFSLKTENDTYPIDTGKDLSQYINKKVRVTGILEHHNT